VNNGLTPRETWEIQDSTKLQCYMDCPRQYFFSYVLGWQPETPNVHLEFGVGIHKAMEVLLRKSFETGCAACEGYTEDAVFEAYEEFEKHYRLYFPEDLDVVNSPKNPSCALRMLGMYANTYKHLDTFYVRHIEVAGSVELDFNKTLYFRSDALCEDDRGEFFSLEHKTASRFSRQWTTDWLQKTQVGVYSHVLYCYYPPERVFGVRINGMIPHEPPRMKKDGTPYANERDCEFLRVPVRKTPDLMEDWHQTTVFWFDQLQTDFAVLDESSPDDTVLRAFPKNPQSCTKYFGCAYADYCHAWTNPLRRAETPPMGFCERHWNPLVELVENAKTKVNF